MTTQFNVPILAFQSRMPVDGLPCMEDWASHALSIWNLGFEGWREAIEIKAISQNTVGRTLIFGSVEAAKGTGRISILLYTLCQTYLMKNSLTQDELDQFAKSFGIGNLWP